MSGGIQDDGDARFWQILATCCGLCNTGQDSQRIVGQRRVNVGNYIMKQVFYRLRAATCEIISAQVIGPLYFTHGPAVLEAVFASIEEWPAPCPGALCPLPFLSETVMFQVPDIDMPPQVASKYG